MSQSFAEPDCDAVVFVLLCAQSIIRYVAARSAVWASKEVTIWWQDIRLESEQHARVYIFLCQIVFSSHLTWRHHRISLLHVVLQHDLWRIHKDCGDFWYIFKVWCLFTCWVCAAAVSTCLYPFLIMTKPSCCHESSY